jgi:two-component system cell cycle sensor histidine kinase/response regulator CckA
VLTSKSERLPAVLEAGATDLYVTSLGPAALELRVLIAERLVAQNARLLNRETRFRRLFDSGVAGVIISDLNGNFKEANDAFLKMLGYTREEMLEGRLNWEVISPLDRLVPDTEDRAQLRATGFLPLRERVYVHKDGRYIAALVGSAALEGTTECISYIADISLRKRDEEALRSSEAQYRALFDQSPFPKFLYDPDSKQIIAVNSTAMQDYGYSQEEFLRMTIEDICLPEDRPQVAPSEGVNEASSTNPASSRHRKKDGTIIDVDVTVNKFSIGVRPCLLAVAIDTTARKRMEEQLRQRQKMEAIGSLAGGIAHDFNNLLSVILGYSDMVSTALKPGDPLLEDIMEITSAGRRAADLTRQLLAFSRQQILQPRVLTLDAVIGGVTKMLSRVLGEDVELVVVTNPTTSSIQADPGQMEQVLMNLVVNARDAMPKGGKLTIETANVTLDSTYAETHRIKAGEYVMLAVSDNGAGMDATTCARIFEPFFTTKDPGKGTGLGLSTVFGVVQQSGGSLVVFSEAGAGTTFKIYLPQSGLAAPASVDMPVESSGKTGFETILLVEDEPAVRALTRTILERSGYTVLEAQSGGDALLICEEHAATIDLLLTDVVMPRMSGRKLAERLAPLRPHMAVLYMSGYTDDSVLRHGVLDSDVAFLQKPIMAAALTQKVREVIDSRGGRRRSRPAAALHLLGGAADFRAGNDESASGTFGVGAEQSQGGVDQLIALPGTVTLSPGRRVRRRRA